MLIQIYKGNIELCKKYYSNINDKLINDLQTNEQHTEQNAYDLAMNDYNDIKLYIEAENDYNVLHEHSIVKNNKLMNRFGTEIKLNEYKIHLRNFVENCDKIFSEKEKWMDREDVENPIYQEIRMKVIQKLLIKKHEMLYKSGETLMKLNDPSGKECLNKIFTLCYQITAPQFSLSKLLTIEIKKKILEIYGKAQLQLLKQ